MDGPWTGSLQRRILQWSAAASALLIATGGFAGGWPAALGVSGALLALALWARRTWWRDLTSQTALVETLGRGEVGEGTLAIGDGAAGRASTVVRELVVERDQALADQSETQDQMARLLDAAPLGVLVIGPDGHIQIANAVAHRLLALQRDPVGLLPVEALPSPELLDVLHVAAQGRAAGPRDLSVRALDLEVTAHPAGASVLAVLRDVSGDRRVERARTDFVANVSHELRTPITAILGYAETVLDTPGLPDDVARFVKVIQRNGHRLRALFEDLLELYKIEARRRELPRERVRLRPVLEQAVLASADAASAKHLSFSLHCPEELEALVNPQALTTIVSNLASNACKYTPSPGRVDVRATLDQGEVVVAVTDTGIGIPAVHQARVFERFYRVDDGRTRDVGGTGLGLAIVKHLAQATGARVTLESKEGGGSTFRLHLAGVPEPRKPTTWDATIANA